MTEVCFEEGECVKYIVAFEGSFPNKGKMIWKTAIVVEVIDFGYAILCEGKVINVSSVDLKRLNESW